MDVHPDIPADISSCFGSHSIVPVCAVQMVFWVIVGVLQGHFLRQRPEITDIKILSMQKRNAVITRRAAAKPTPAGVPHEVWLFEQLKNPAEAAAYIEAAIEEGDQPALMTALRHVVMAQGGIARIARKLKLTREATYRMLSAPGNLELQSLTAILGAAGLRLSVRPVTQRAA